jgi:hypothetical protein
MTQKCKNSLFSKSESIEKGAGRCQEKKTPQYGVFGEGVAGENDSIEWPGALTGLPPSRKGEIWTMTITIVGSHIVAMSSISVIGKVGSSGMGDDAAF